MRYFSLVVAQISLLCHASTAEEFLAHSLGWYSKWWNEAAERSVERCAGIRRGNRIVVLCNPLAVRIDIEIGRNGVCNISSFRETNESFDGIVQELVRSSPGAAADPGRRNCLGLDSELSPKTFQVPEIERTTDDSLGALLRKQVMAWLSRSGWLTARYAQACSIYLPRVNTGDPLFHVYVMCKGQVSEVWEFAAGEETQIADFPHWTYTESRGLPVGASERILNPRLWSGILRPVRSIGHEKLSFPPRAK